MATHSFTCKHAIPAFTPQPLKAPEWFMLDLLAGVPSHSFRYPHHVLCPGMARFSARYCTWRHCCTIYHCVRRRQFFRGRLCYGTVVLSVCLCVCLSVAFVCCGQTARWIKMSLCTKVGLGPGHMVKKQKNDRFYAQQRLLRKQHR